MMDAAAPPPTDFCCTADPDAGYVAGIARCNASFDPNGCSYDPPATFDLEVNGSPLPVNAAFIVNEHDDTGACPGYSASDRHHTCYTFGAWTGANDNVNGQSPLFALIITYTSALPSAWSKCYGPPPCPAGIAVDGAGVCCQSPSTSTPDGSGAAWTFILLPEADFAPDAGVGNDPALGIPGIDPDPPPVAPTPIPEPQPEAGPPVSTIDAAADASADATMPEASSGSEPSEADGSPSDASIDGAVGADMGGGGGGGGCSCSLARPALGAGLDIRTMLVVLGTVLLLRRRPIRPRS